MNKGILKAPPRREFIRRSLGLFLILTALTAVEGCSQKDASTAPAPAPVTSAPPIAASPAPPVEHVQPTAQPAAANNQPDLPELNRTLIRWIVRNKRVPANFQEFAATAGVAIPPPPAGQQYVIGADKHIRLVNQ